MWEEAEGKLIGRLTPFVFVIGVVPRTIASRNELVPANGD